MSITTTGRRSAAAGLAATVLAGALLVAAPAHADSGSWSDPDDQPGRAHDLRRVVAHHGEQKVIVRAEIDHLTRERVGGIQVFVDTRRARTGPEFGFIGGIFEGTDYAMWRMREWRYTGDTPLECDYDLDLRYRADVVRVVMDRDCVAGARRVRLAVTVNSGAESAGTDWLGSRREFTPPLASA